MVFHLLKMKTSKDIRYSVLKSVKLLLALSIHIEGGLPQGFWGSGEKGYLFSGSWGALLIILGELGSKHILFGI